jgi:hypothetical protein
MKLLKRGKNFLAGHPDQGKSLVSLYMIAQLTRGLPMHGGHSSATMTARYTGEIPMSLVRSAFYKKPISRSKNHELENMENEAAA